MKIPTYQKYGITKSEMLEMENKHRRVLHLLTHRIPFLISIPIMVTIFYIYFISSDNSELLPKFSKIFVIGSVILMSVGFPMIIFNIIGWIYSKYIIPRSVRHQTIRDYSEVRDKYEFWKIRCDYNFWKLLDSLSLERELLKVYLLNNYNLKKEITHKDGHSDYILDNKNTFILRVSTEHQVSSEEEIKNFIALIDVSEAEYAIWFSVKGYEKNLVNKFVGGKIQFKTLQDIPKIIKDFKKGSNF